MRPNMLANIKQTITAMQSVGDVSKLTEMLLQNKNPALAKAMEYVKQNGGDPETACMKLLQDNGIDPAEVKNLIK